MPELKSVDKNGWTDADVDVSVLLFFTSLKLIYGQWETFTYADNAQETKRLTALAVDREMLEKKQEQRRHQKAQKKRLNSAWSEQTLKKEQRDKRRDKRVKRRKWLSEQGATEIAASENPPSKRAHPKTVGEGSDDEDDWDELAQEERMAKKLRKGEISQQDFDTAFMDM
jgi:ATP-dependent RNA helicase DDX55/SPB4